MVELKETLLKHYLLLNLSRIVFHATTFFATFNYVTEMVTRNPVRDNVQEYDFIVVGAGSAGGIIANRLSESGKYKVLLLEAGGDPVFTETVPFLSGLILHNEMTDWAYKTVPQKNSCFAYDNNVMPWPRGKSLGGTSNLNHMIYMRGNPKDYDNWAEMVEDSQWKYDNLLPFFKKFEKYRGHFPSSEYHGKSGPMQINMQEFEPQAEDWLRAGHELGLPKGDPNARQESGFFPGDYTVNQDGSRCGVFQAFIKPALNRPNLEVSRYSRVIQINFSESLRRKANGVTYIKRDKTVTVKAKKEVIISAGAIGTPHLLLLSGIGPKEHLKSFGIPLKADLPGVGSNLQDHVSTFFGPFLLNQTVSFMLDRDMNNGHLFEYMAFGTGPLAFNYISGLGLINSSIGEFSWPDIALTYVPLGVHPSLAKDTNAFFGVSEDYVDSYTKEFSGQDANFVLLYNGLPKSTGTIRLKSTCPFDHPLIDPNYYGDPKDVRVMVDGIKFVTKMFETLPVWQQYNARLPEKLAPGCENLKPKSDEYYECYIRHFTATMWHPTSTCKMGRDNDPMAVLDSDLSVRKVKGLRVADTSVMPKIPNTNTQAPAMMIGEKAADLILKAWS